MNKNQNDECSQQNVAESDGKTNMDLDKTPGRVENPKEKNTEQNTPTSDLENDNRNNQSQDEENADQNAIYIRDNQKEKSDLKPYESNNKKQVANKGVL